MTALLLKETGTTAEPVRRAGWSSRLHQILIRHGCTSAYVHLLRPSACGRPVSDFLRLALCDNDADDEVWEAGLILSSLSEKWRHAVSMKVGEDLLKLSRNSFTDWLDV